MATLSETVSDAAGKRLFALAGFVAVVIITLLLAFPEESKELERPPVYEALAMPGPGLPPLPLAGISNHYGIGDGTVVLIIDGTKVTLYGIPVMVYPAPPQQSSSFGTPSLEARSTLR